MKVLFLILGIVISTLVYGQKSKEKTSDIDKSIDSMSLKYKKNVSSYFVHESRDSITVKVYYRETEFGEEKLLIITSEVKRPSRLPN
jgi:hypothetical protein